MKIFLSGDAPEYMEHLKFWADFFVGTHWRNPKDNAEVVVKYVRYCGYGEIDECDCDACNNQYSIMGNKVRSFPFRLGIGHNYSTSFSELVRNGFILVPYAIQTTKTSLAPNADRYLNELRNMQWGDYGLRAPKEEYELSGRNGRYYNAPIAFLSIGIPPGRLVSVKGLVLGGKGSEPDYCYNEVY